MNKIAKEKKIKTRLVYILGAIILGMLCAVKFSILKKLNIIKVSIIVLTRYFKVSIIRQWLFVHSCILLFSLLLF